MRSSRPRPRDGHHVEVAANIGGLKDADQVAELGGDGVGLLRSEFLFMERSAAPSEDEQFEEYKAIALAVGADRPVIIRTLDVGGDKPLAYLPIPRKTIRSSVNAAFASGSTGRKSSARSFALFSALPSSGSCASCFR